MSERARTSRDPELELPDDDATSGEQAPMTRRGSKPCEIKGRAERCRSSDTLGTLGHPHANSAIVAFEASFEAAIADRRHSLRL